MCVWPPSCTVSQHVRCCWLRLEKGQNFSCNICQCCMLYCLARFAQQCCTRACTLVRFATPNMWQHIAIGWSSTCNMLSPTDVANMLYWNDAIIRPVHRALQFSEKPWLKEYIEFNTEKRKEAKNSFEKDYFKLMNNSVFGKTMENIRKRCNVYLETDRDHFYVKQQNQLMYCVKFLVKI